MKGRRGALLRVAVSAGLLLVLFRTVDLGELARQMRGARPAPLLGAVLLYCVVGTWARAERWRVLAVAQGFDLGIGRSLRLFLVGMLFGQVLPTGVGGDVVRALMLARGGPGRARAFGTVLVDRALGLLPLLAAGLLALAMVPDDRNIPPAVWSVLLVAGAGGLVAMAALLRAHAWRDRLARWPGIGWVLRRPSVARFVDSFADYDGRTLGIATAWSVAFVVLLVVSNMLLGRAVHIDTAGLGDWFVIVPLASLSLLLPSVGGWGVREWSYVALLVGLHPEVAIESAAAAALLFGCLNLIIAAAGGAVAAFGRTEVVPDAASLGAGAGR